VIIRITTYPKQLKQLGRAGKCMIAKAYAVLNPNKKGADILTRWLCGAGIAFKLVQD